MRRTRDKKRSSNWTGNVRARDAGENLRVVPYWEQATDRSDRLRVVIDPGPSFGAGDHPTTLMALELLERAVTVASRTTDRPSLLDVGTGTGVLAIAGIVLGTGFTAGLDIDASSIHMARRNFVLNGIPPNLGPDGCGTGLFVGGIEAVRGSFHVVAANLAAPTLQKLAPNIIKAAGVFLILSGMAEAMADSTLALYSSGGMNIVSRLDQDGWHAALLKA